VCSPSAVMCLDDLHAEVAVGVTKTQRVCFSVGPSKGQCRGPDGKLVPGPCVLPLIMAFVSAHLRRQPGTLLKLQSCRRESYRVFFWVCCSDQARHVRT
jgi:hypothetical protein